MKNLIPLCGYPNSGKSTAQRIIEQRYGAIPIDDGQPIREASKILYGLTDWHVYTQEGKEQYVEVTPGNLVQVRKLLGDLGKQQELYDLNFFAHKALARADREHPGQIVCFGSVRRSQASVYAATGRAVVLEIRRPGIVAQNDFDEFDRRYIDAVIENDFDPADPEGSLRRLEERIAALLDPLLLPIAA